MTRTVEVDAEVRGIASTSVHLMAAATLGSHARWIGLLKTSGSGDDAAVLAFLLVVVVLILIWCVILLAAIRTLSNRSHPVSASGGSSDALGAVRFKGGTIFAVDGRRLQCSYPFAEIVVDGDEARISMRSPLPGLSGEHVVRRDEVSAIHVSQRLGLPYVEFDDHVRKNGVTRFYAGRNLVVALAERGWPVEAER